MKKVLFAFSLIICQSLILTAQSEKKFTSEEYIAQYKDFAVIEMHTYGIPASITLAQGILESSNGNSRLAKEGNNHFGIKCKSDWTGKTIYVDDDAPNECFRAYNSPLESFKDHSEFLKTNWRYNELFKLQMTDYKGWSEGLRKAGYATNPKYHEILINLIERYKLYQYDYIPKPGAPEHELEIRNNDIPAVYAQQGETVKDIAKKNDLPENRIYKWNDLPKGAEISEGDILYLKPKKRNGSAEMHVVQPGESMYDISQMYGIKLKHLYKKNRIDETVTPAPGEKIYMQEKRDKDDPVKPASAAPAKPAEVKKPDFVNPNLQKKEDDKQEVDTLPANPEFHIVKAGDNIYRIAERYKILEEDLLKWNQLEVFSLQPGQKLYLSKEAAEKNIVKESTPKVTTPEKKPEPPATPVKYHVVKAGETVYRICVTYGITAEQLAKWNNLKGNNIFEGQKLKVSE